MPKVSVIVPAYNAEDTLRRTVEDLLAQTYQDFEIILVDDGSKDGTAAICDQLAGTDGRIRALHQSNGGISNARNNGTKMAEGRYISYVDGDDRLDRRFLEYLVRAADETGADLVGGQVDRVREGQEAFGEAGPFNAMAMDVGQALRKLGTGVFPVGAWCKLALRSSYIRHPFLEGKLYEDLSNTYKIVLESRKVAFVDAVLYHYVMRSGSITGRKRTTRKQCLDYDEAIRLCYDGVCARCPEVKDSMAVLRIKDLMSLYLSINRCPEKDEALEKIQREAVSWVKQNWRTAFSNRGAARELRLRILLFAMSPKLYERAYYYGIVFKGKGLS